MRHWFIRTLCTASLTALTMLSGCSTPQKMSDTQLQSLDIRVGTPHWSATSTLHREGYACFVNGEKREHFDCTKTTGFFPTCILRIEFIVDDGNKISEISVREPVCTGTP
jgi:hypothetical protein